MGCNPSRMPRLWPLPLRLHAEKSYLQHLCTLVDIVNFNASGKSHGVITAFSRIRTPGRSLTYLPLSIEKPRMGRSTGPR